LQSARQRADRDLEPYAAAELGGQRRGFALHELLHWIGGSGLCAGKGRNRSKDGGKQAFHDGKSECTCAHRSAKKAHASTAYRPIVLASHANNRQPWTTL
jgi:hypothetical protein